MDWTLFPVFLVASLLVTLAPGPDNIYVLTRSAAEGRETGLAAAAGFGLGNLFHTFLAAVGISALIAASPVAFTIVKYAGAAYLAWIGYSILKDKSEIGDDTEFQPLSRWQVFRQSVIANMLNPKVAVFFLAFIPQYVNQEAGPVWLQFTVYGVFFALQAWLVFSVIALGSSGIGSLIRRKPSVQCYIKFVAGAVLIGLACKLVISK